MSKSEVSAMSSMLSAWWQRKPDKHKNSAISTVLPHKSCGRMKMLQSQILPKMRVLNINHKTQQGWQTNAMESVVLLTAVILHFKYFIFISIWWWIMFELDNCSIFILPHDACGSTMLTTEFLCLLVGSKIHMHNDRSRSSKVNYYDIIWHAISNQ